MRNNPPGPAGPQNMQAHPGVQRDNMHPVGGVAGTVGALSPADYQAMQAQFQNKQA